MLGGIDSLGIMLELRVGSIDFRNGFLVAIANSNKKRDGYSNLLHLYRFVVFSNAVPCLILCLSS